MFCVDAMRTAGGPSNAFSQASGEKRAGFMILFSISSISA
jgi:hypothetical protein